MTETTGKTAGRPANKPKTAGSAVVARARGRRGGPNRSTIIAVAVVAVFAVTVLFMVYRSAQGGTSASDGGSGFKHQVGDRIAVQPRQRSAGSVLENVWSMVEPLLSRALSAPRALHDVSG